MANPGRMWGVCACLLLALVCGSARAQSLAGVGSCRASEATGGLIGGGGATGLLEALSGAAATQGDCLPSEPASLPTDAPSRFAGNPVDLATGEKVDRAIDAGRPRSFGEAPLPWTFTRFYGSAHRGSAALGPGWRHGFETRLHAMPGGHESPVLLVRQADGRELRFERRTPVNAVEILLQTDDPRDGVLEAVHAASPLVWSWRWPSGRQLQFAQDGRLMRVVSEQGWTVALRYDAAGRLVRLSDASARVLYLDHEARAGHHRLVRLRGAARVDYFYDREGRLAEVRHTGGRFVRYRYADPGSARLVALELDDGRSADYGYDAQGRVVRSRAAGDQVTLRFDYRSPQGDLPGATRVEVDGREQAVYRWRAFADGLQLVDAQGPGCARCPPTGSRYGYEDRRIAWIERAGQRWSLRRDVHGRVLEVLRTPIEDGPGAAVRVLALQWDTDRSRDRLRTLIRPSAFESREVTLHFNHAADGTLRDVLRRGWAPMVVADRLGARRIGVRPIEERVGAELAFAGPEPVPDTSPGALFPDPDGAWHQMTANGVSVRHWWDDFGRRVATDSPDHGLQRRAFDARGRLAREDAADGAFARYRYAENGLLRERVLTAADGRTETTRYTHEGARLSAIDHPSQSESYGYDPDGRLAERTVRLHLGDGRSPSFTMRFRYGGDAGAPAAMSLPDGSWLHFAQDPTAQIVGLHRHAAAEASPESGPHRAVVQPLADGLVRDRHGLLAGRFGNGVEWSVRRDPRGKPEAICHGAADRGCDVLDHRLRFDARGRLVAWQRADGDSRFLFDARGALVQAARVQGSEVEIRRYAYDANGNRLLAEEGPGDTHVARAERVPGSNRVWPSGGAASDRVESGETRWDRAGRLLRDGRRTYRWDAAGLLRSVSDAGRVVARYRYNHRGERIAKWTRDGWRYFLHDASRRLIAELDADARVRRQYLWLADLPIAVLDREAGRERLTWLHLNHLGAPEAATDSRGRVVWRATYAPFGRRMAPDGPHVGADRFEQPLRLPGQYEDAETGLHFNDHRYYDPDAGRYLSPDPLGLLAGPNPYVYAANDPLTRIDPTGLLLFAFDGTNNSEQPPGQDDWSNVYKLARSYDDGRVWYVGGVGTPLEGAGNPGALDAITAGSARARVDRMLNRLDAFLASSEARGRWFDVDVIGFSRGAAMGRDFVNRVAARIDAGADRVLGACLRLRFLGLWDTVAQFGLNGALDLTWRLAVPARLAYAAHAVALNEHRLLFPVESIAGSPLGGVRVERGFVGAHADVGGSHAEGDLSDVALGWMHAQARLAGVRLRALPAEYTRVSTPLLHDANTSGLGDREFRRRGPWGTIVAHQWQRLAAVDGLQWRDTAQWITRYPVPRPDAYGEPTLAGEVDMAGYAAWLRRHYGFEAPGL